MTMNPPYRMVAWGANTFGQLALSPIDHPLPTPCPLPTSDQSCALPPKVITGGANHSLLVDAHGQSLYACGSNEYGQLGVPPTDPSLVPIPLGPTSTATVPSAFSWTRIPLPIDNDGESKISAAAAGWAHTLVVIEPEGYILACGDNTHGQLNGTPTKSQPTTTTAGAWLRVPVPNSADDPVTQVAAGLRHSVALTRSGRVFVWGAARHGQSGPSYTGGIGELLLPVLNQVPSSIAAGSYHTLIATRLHVYGCGLNKHGQLGVQPVGKVHKVFDVVKCYELAGAEEGSISRVHAGWSHSIVESSAGSLVMFGRNTYHQLGQNDGDDSTFSPVSVHLPRPIRAVAPGSEHTTVLCSEGDSGLACVYSWGWNEHGNCGVPCSPQLNGWQLIPVSDRPPVESLHLPNVAAPTRVQIELGPHEQIIMIGSGYAHGFAVICSTQ